MFEKIIWIYWEQGWDKVPRICTLCKQSWEKLNSTTWKINILDKNNLNDFINVNVINSNFWNIKPIQARADIIRTLLLQKYGGVWVDSTVICMKPLDDWLFKYFDINYDNDFFTFKELIEKINLSNWFLVSHPNKYIINKFTEKYTNYFKTNLISPKYFQFHQDFCSLMKNDSLFYKYYNKNKKLCSVSAKIFSFKIGFNGTLNIDNIIKQYNSPLYKLTYKKKLDYTKDTYISKLFKKIDIDIKIDDNIKYEPHKIINTTNTQNVNIKNTTRNNQIKNRQKVNTSANTNTNINTNINTLTQNNRKVNRQIENRQTENNQKVDFRKVDFRKVDFRKVDFRKVDFRKVNIRKVNIRRVNIRRVNIRKVNIRKVINNTIKIIKKPIIKSKINLI
jgi:hypothetical protein